MNVFEKSYTLVDANPKLDDEGSQRRRDSSMRGGVTEILIAASSVLLSMTAMTATILGLIFHHRVSNSHDPQDPFSYAEDNSSYFVDVSAPTLIFVSSVSSSLAFPLRGLFMTLISFPVAKRFLEASRRRDPSRLPTPFQFNLLTNILTNGGIAPTWRWLKYQFSWRGKREPVVDMLYLAGNVCLLVVFGTIFIFAADVWLHLATHAVNFPLIQPAPASSAMYGAGLSRACVSSNNTYLDDNAANFNYTNKVGGCTLLITGDHQSFLGTKASMDVLNNASSSHGVYFNYPERTSFLGPASIEEVVQSTDFQATSYGVSTTCKPVSRQCNLYARSGVETDFNCSNSFYGDLTSYPSSVGGYDLTFFTDSTFKDNQTDAGVGNQFHFGFGVSFLNVPNFYDPEIETPVHGGMAIVLSCFTTIYDLQYSYKNGALIQFDPTMSNTSVTNMFQTPLASVDEIVSKPLSNAALTAALSNSSQEIADNFANSFSTISLGIAAGLMKTTPVDKVQTKKTILVSKVYKAPLFTLVAANMVFGLAALVMGIWALFINQGGKNEIRDVQNRLNGAALVAELFESSKQAQEVRRVEDLYQERFNGRLSARVAIVNEKGVWQFAGV